MVTVTLKRGSAHANLVLVVLRANLAALLVPHHIVVGLLMIKEKVPQQKVLCGIMEADQPLDWAMVHVVAKPTTRHT